MQRNLHKRRSPHPASKPLDAVGFVNDQHDAPRFAEFDECQPVSSGTGEADEQETSRPRSGVCGSSLSSVAADAPNRDAGAQRRGHFALPRTETRQWTHNEKEINGARRKVCGPNGQRNSGLT
jgi:hypothetical protein